MAGDFTIEFEFRNKRFQDAAKGLLAFSKSLNTAWVRNLPDVLKRELKAFLDLTARALSQRHGNPWPGGTSGSTLSRRSGALVSAIQNSVKVYGNTLRDIQGTIGAPGLLYGRIQETGGVITPKRAQYLTVPLPAALNADGTPKKRSARDWDKTFIIRSKAGNLLIVQKNGRDLVPLYVLRTSVTIPSRMQMRKTLETGLGYFVDKAQHAMLTEIQRGLAL